ncbi:hypothetical protein R3P38DRAFT_2758818 [Favolaschia claudopus]|uniref:Uncharacterized protein n=1 Tax=Favolaschia claudopus TaxID=2862362 RepID=A0AAW0E5I0_9AGAR
MYFLNLPYCLILLNIRIRTSSPTCRPGHRHTKPTSVSGIGPNFTLVSLGAHERLLMARAPIARAERLLRRPNAYCTPPGRLPAAPRHLSPIRALVIRRLPACGRDDSKFSIKKIAICMLSNLRLKIINGLENVNFSSLQ